MFEENEDSRALKAQKPPSCEEGFCLEGCLTGVEPATPGSTVQYSAIELQAPYGALAILPRALLYGNSYFTLIKLATCAIS